MEDILFNNTNPFSLSGGLPLPGNDFSSGLLDNNLNPGAAMIAGGMSSGFEQPLTMPVQETSNSGLGLDGNFNSVLSSNLDAATEGSNIDPLTGTALESSSNQPLVGIIDTGFSANDPDIDYSRTILGRDRIDGDDNPLVTEGVDKEHGTQVLDIVGATQDNGIGINGINDDAPLWLGRAVGSGKWAESLVEFVDAAKISGQPNAVINLSFDLIQTNPDGSVTTRYELTSQERSALEYARQNGVLIVAAAGNNGGTMSALGQASQEFDNIITVGTADDLDRANYSSYGNGLTILASDDAAGTSIATAKVTGAVSQMWSENSQLNYHQVIDILKSTATDLNAPGWDAETGAGLLNLNDAISMAAITTPVAYETPVGGTSLTLTEQTAETPALERPAWGFPKIKIPNPVKVVKDVGSGVVNVAKNVGSGVVNVATDIGSGVVDVATDIGSGAVDIATDVGSGVVDVVTDIGSGVIDAAKDIGSGNFVDAAKDIGSSVIDVGQTVRNTVVDVVQTVGNTTIDVGQTVGNTTIDVAQTVGNTAIDVAQTVGNTVVDGAQVVIGAVGADELNKVIDNGQASINTAIDSAQAVGNAVVDGVQVVGNTAIDGAQAHANAVVDNAQNFLGSVAKGDWEGALGALNSILIESTGIPKLLEIFVSLVDNPRPMTSEQIETARSVFGDSINYDLVRIDDSSHLLDVLDHLGLRDKGRALTTFNIINSWGPMDKPTLIHELTHVWQYQHDGATYAAEALAAQSIAAIKQEDAYDYGDVMGLNGKDFTDFNREQQAHIVEDYFIKREDGDPSNDGELKIYAHFVKEVSTLSEDQLD